MRRGTLLLLTLALGAAASPAAASELGVSGSQLYFNGTEGNDTVSVTREQGAVVFASGDLVTVQPTADARCDDSATTVRCDTAGLTSVVVNGRAGVDSISVAPLPAGVTGPDVVVMPSIAQQQAEDEWRQVNAAKEEINPSESSFPSPSLRRVPARVSARWSVGRRSTVVRSLVVRGLPRTALVDVTVDGETWSDLRPGRRRRVDVARQIGGIVLSPGTRVSVHVSARGFAPRTFRWRTRAGRAPRRLA